MSAAPPHRHLSAAHFALVLAIVAVWGSNFVVIKLGLRDFPPFLFALLRFLFSALPFVFFLRRPAVEWRWLVMYGVFLGAGQFGLLFYAMRADISPGMTSLVVQLQVFFTIALSIWLFHERISRITLAGGLLAAAGLGVIGLHLDATVTAAGIGEVACAAFFWGCANICVKMAMQRSKKRFDMLAFIAWSSVFAVPPLLALTLVFEGWDVGWHAVSNAHWDAWLAVVWQVAGNTLFAFSAWSLLLTRYDAATIAPYALLIPIFGMGSSAILLGEPMPPWKLAASAMVLGGIALITIVGASRRR